MRLFGWNITRDPVIEKLSRLDVKPGDVIVLYVDGHLSEAIAVRLKAVMEEHIKHLGAKVLVLEKTLSLSVLSKIEASR